MKKHAAKFSFFLISCCLMLLTACGFHLRGATQLPPDMKQLLISPDTPYTDLQKILRDALHFSGVTTIESAADTSQTMENTYRLQLSPEVVSRETLSVGPDGQVRQVLLRYQLTYTLFKGPVFLASKTIQEERVLNVNLNQILGQNEEEATSVHEMRIDAVRQLMRQLSKIPQLEISTKNDVVLPAKN